MLLEEFIAGPADCGGVRVAEGDLQPGPGEVLLENEFTVISAGTERANLVGLPNTSGAFPFYPGYCGLGHVIAVGDMACSPTDPKFNGGAGTGGECEAQRVSDAAVARNPQLLLVLGDYQYEVASAADYAAGYAPTWGRLKEITRPAIGNQELKVNKASTSHQTRQPAQPISTGPTASAVAVPSGM